MISELILKWTNQNKIFYQCESEKISYDQLFEDLKKINFPQRNSNDLFCLRGNNNYFTYLYFLKALEDKIPVILISEQFLDLGNIFQEQIPFLKKELFFGKNKNSNIYQKVNYDFSNDSYFLIRTSGSSGIPKIIIHKARNFVNKYKSINKNFDKTLAFSPIDTIAGVETLLEVVTLGKTLIGRNETMEPEKIVKMINLYKIDYLQTTPSFLNLLVISKQIEKLKNSPLKQIDFGSEPSQANILNKISYILPEIKLKQTYGLSEVGILPTIYQTTDISLFQLNEIFSSYKIIDDILYLKTDTLLINYLNNNLELYDGFFKTNDLTEKKETLLQVKGRNYEMINIGGRKFFPIELENILSLHPKIKNCLVKGIKNDFLGEMIQVKIELFDKGQEQNFRNNFLEFCEKNIPTFMRPHILDFNYSPDETKLKKMRN